MSRRCVRDLWYSEVIRTRLVSGSCRELLSLMAVRHMTERGYVKVPRERLADDLGVKPQRITDRITEATRAGLLARVSGGHNGQVAQYAAQLPSRKVPAEPVPTGRVGTGRTDTTEPIPTRVIGRSRSVAKVSAEPDPYDARAHVRGTSRARGTEPAPDGSRGPGPHHSPNSSSNGEGATPASLVAAGPWVPTTQPQLTTRRTA